MFEGWNRIVDPPRQRGRGVTCTMATVCVAAFLTGVGGAAHGAEPELAAAPSTGCAEPAPAPGESTLPFAAGGTSGTYLRDVPPGADRPLPVVLDLHGFLEPAAIQHSETGFGEFGRNHGFVTITPQLDEWELPQWDFGRSSTDVAYLSELLTHVESTQCVDQRRVFVTGLSMGAFTTSSLGCQLSDRIAAIAPVAGLQNFGWCHTTRPVPVVAFHGTADPIVAYTGGSGPNARFLPAPNGSGSADEQQPEGRGPGPESIESDAAAWAQRNECGPEPSQQRIAPDVTLHSYSCPADATVQLYSIIGGGHVWPGATSSLTPTPIVGKNTTSINATSTIWDFFRAHPLPH